MSEVTIVVRITEVGKLRLELDATELEPSSVLEVLNCTLDDNHVDSGMSIEMELVTTLEPNEEILPAVVVLLLVGNGGGASYWRALTCP